MDSFVSINPLARKRTLSSHRRGGGRNSISGEAVVVDLGDGKYLFALLKGYSHETAIKAFADSIPEPTNRAQSIKTYNALERLRATRQPQLPLYPTLVTFDDVDDPASVVKVDPIDLAAAFGAGYQLSYISTALTEHAGTAGSIGSLLNWLGPYPEPKLSPATGATSDIPFSRRVSYGDFRKE
ncbi:hypothetical protein J2Z17_004670 [Rhizobium halophytocola]|uniref:Uncharacterized protein n=1 Tax=Rhizobium halophytocola TaxID=735519 RepID=A0ABS4E5I2_9HYPH|nr:hypothetical protein [Rhizobium halophytocola]